MQILLQRKLENSISIVLFILIFFHLFCLTVFIYFAIFCKSIIVIVSLLITTRESLHTIITIAKIGYMNPLYCFLGDSINIYKYSNVRNEILQKRNFTFTYIRFLNYIKKKKDAKNLKHMLEFHYIKPRSSLSLIYLVYIFCSSFSYTDLKYLK